MAGVTKVFNATTTGALPAIASRGARAFHKFAWQVKGVGAAPTAFSVTLEGSLDSVNYNTIGTAITTPDGIIGYAIDKPSLFVRANVGSLVLGSATSVNVTVTASGD